MPEANKLTPLKIKSLNKPGLYGDGRGLYLQVSPATAKGGPEPRCTKSWLYRFMIDGQARKMGLGSVDAVPLARAREKAAEARRLVADGTDPIEAREKARLARRLERARAKTFRECATEYIGDHEQEWRNPKHRAQWGSTLEAYAYPLIGSLPVADVDQAMILNVLRPIWRDKTETAKRLRGRIETILDWAKAHGYREGDNPARWRGHLQHALPAPSKIAPVKHHPAMPYGAVPAYAATLRGRNIISARALEFAILTAARTGEVIGARPGEIDRAGAVWTVPAERMKSGREHAVPLSARALEIVSDLPAGAEWLFPGDKPGAPLSNMAMLEFLRGTHSDLTVHGFRSAFRDWAGDCTDYPRDLIEFALAHKLKDETEAAYRRSSALEKRRQLMTDWADYLAGGKP